MDLDILKSYLVKIGFQVNDSEFDKVKKAINDISNLLQKQAEGFAKEYIKAGSVVVGAIVSVDTAIISMIKHMASADMEYQLFAQKMYMSADAAKAFKITTDALGHSLNEIAWNPELRGHYFSLIKEVKEMQVTPQAREMFKNVRDIGYEWTRLKTESTSAMGWISFHLLKLNKGELFTFKSFVKDMNDSIQKNMPEWTAKAASFLNVFVMAGRDIGLLLGGILLRVKELFGFMSGRWDKMKTWVKDIALLSGALAALFGSFMIGGKFGAFMRGLGYFTAALVALDDAIAHFEGRPAKFDWLWNIAEKIDMYFIKVIGNALIAWTHFQKAIHGKEGWNEAWSNMMKDKAEMNAKIDAEVASMQAERKASADKIRKAMGEDDLKGKEATKYTVPEVSSYSPNRLSGNQFSGVEDFKRALGFQESGGNYDAVGPMNTKGRGTAKGKFQFTDESWKSWTKKFYGTSDIARTPENQEGVATAAIEYLYKKYNNWQLVSAAWAAGESRADRIKAGDKSVLGYSMGGGLKQNVNEYIKKITGAYYQQGQEGMNAFSSSSNRGGNNVNITHGDMKVEVNVPQPGATAEEIGHAVRNGISVEMAKRDLMLNREFAGAF
jgi:hypothetical protein